MRTFLLIFLLSCSIAGRAQTVNNSESKYEAFINTPIPQERYKVDYETAEFHKFVVILFFI